LWYREKSGNPGGNVWVSCFFAERMHCFPNKTGLRPVQNHDCVRYNGPPSGFSGSHRG
jgi:hypothetical protein